jgi:hypothetical protein
MDIFNAKVKTVAERRNPAPRVAEFHQDLADGYAFGAQRQWPDGAAPELGVC